MQNYCTGMDQLLERADCELLLGGRVGLVCHPASRNAQGHHSAALLRNRVGDRLCCLMGPEHGFFGSVGPGEDVQDARHPEWNIPIYSLYGDTKAAMSAMATEVDVIVMDLQDLSVRCYTYIHTLRQIIETAAQQGVRVVVTDRAVPLAGCVDGPMLEEGFRSTVAPACVPFVYGMTPGETARWMVDMMQLDVGLTVVPARYTRGSDPSSCWPTWVPPSPAIRSWNCAVCFPVTVFTEALLQIDCARQTEWAFQVLRADWLEVDDLLEALTEYELPGIVFDPFVGSDGESSPGIRLHVLDVSAYRPARSAVAILHALAQVHGFDRIWQDPCVRHDWFDKLMGTDRVRRALLAGDSVATICREWEPGLTTFSMARRNHLLYPEAEMAGVPRWA